jgi:hypothetical protein
MGIYDICIRVVVVGGGIRTGIILVNVCEYEGLVRIALFVPVQLIDT